MRLIRARNDREVLRVWRFCALRHLAARNFSFRLFRERLIRGAVIGRFLAQAREAIFRICICFHAERYSSNAGKRRSFRPTYLSSKYRARLRQRYRIPEVAVKITATHKEIFVNIGTHPLKTGLAHAPHSG